MNRICSYRNWVITLLLLVSNLLFIRLLKAQNSVPSFVDSTGLVAWYTFDNHGNDSSGNGYGLNFVGSPAYGLNRNLVASKSLNLNGLNQSGSVAHNSKLSITGDFTFAAWVRDSASFERYQTIIAKEINNKTTYRLGVHFDNSISKKGRHRMYLARHNDGGNFQLCFSGDTLPLNRWTHIAVNIHKDTVNFYINGKSVGCLRDTNPFLPYPFGEKFVVAAPDTISPVTVGVRGNGTELFRGNLDQLFLYSRALSTCKIIQLMKETNPIVQKGYTGVSVFRCGLDSMVFTATAGMKSYLWSTGSVTKRGVVFKSNIIKLFIEDSSGCIWSDSLKAVFSNPKFMFPSDTLIHTDCKRDSFRLGVGNQWKTVNWNTGKTDSVIFINTTGVYKVLVSDTNNCYTGDSVGYINAGKAKLVALPADSVSCNGVGDGSASVQVLGGFSPWNLQWNDPSKQTSIKATGLKAGSYTATLADKYGCMDSVTISVKEPLGLSVVFTDIDSVNCFGGSDGAVTATVSGGTPPYTYIWNDALAQKTALVMALKAGNYSVQVRDFYGCFESKSINIPQPLILDVSLVKVDSVRCFGEQNGAIQTIVSGGNGSYQFLWNDVLAQRSSVASNLKIGLYGVLVTDQYGCKDTLSAIVKQPAKLVFTRTGIDSSRCFQSYTGRIRTKTSGGNGGYLYSWDDDKNQKDSWAINLKSGLYKAKVLDRKGCSDSITGWVSEPPAVRLSFLGKDSVICWSESNGKVRTSAIGGVGKIRFIWNDPLKQNTPAADSLKAGMYRVYAKDGYGCLDSLLVEVLEPQKLSIQVVAIDSVNCFGGIDGKIEIGITGGNHGYQWKWSDSLLRKSLRAYNLKSNNYKVNAVDRKGCKDSIIVFVPQPDILNITFSRVDSVTCFGGINGGVFSSVSGGNGGYTYQWDDPKSRKSTGIDSVKSGRYKLIVKDIYGCTDIDSAFVPQYPRLIASVKKVDSVSCFGYSDGRIFGQAVGGTGFYRWLWETNPAQFSDSAIGLRAGSYQFKVSDNYGCTDSLRAEVFQPDSVWVKISPNRYSMKGEVLPMRCEVFPPQSYRYLWEPKTLFGNFDRVKDPNIRLQNTTHIKVTITNGRGCVVSDTNTVFVVLPLKMIIPNAFSPDGDSVNEGFGLPSIFDTDVLVIYDRFGGEVFRGDLSTPRWDGRVKGIEAPVGVYYYTVEGRLRGTDQVVRYGGNVTLVR